jgi:hypothetical protein
VFRQVSPTGIFRRDPGSVRRDPFVSIDELPGEHNLMKLSSWTRRRLRRITRPAAGCLSGRMWLARRSREASQPDHRAGADRVLTDLHAGQIGLLDIPTDNLTAPVVTGTSRRTTT